MANNQIGEKVTFDGDQMIIKRTFDASGMIQDAEYARQTSPNVVGSDWKSLGTIEPALLTNWLREAGVDWSDTHAVQEIIKRKLMDGEFAQLRNWEGKY
jgi:hypothetical protein